MKTEQIIVNNRLISYFSDTTAGQKCLLFLHGWRSNKEIWLPVISEVKKRGWGIYALDLPGFGQSEMPKAPMTVGDYAEVVAESVKKMDLKNLIIVGHSFGGRIGIKLAAIHPDLVAKLVLVNSAGFVSNQAKKTLMALAAKIAKPFFQPKIMQELRKKIYQHIGAEDYVAIPELQKTFVSVVNEDLSEDMGKIQIPTLIIHGQNDKETPVDFGERMKDIISGSRLEILQDAGHYSFLDQREKFVKLLVDFIK